MACSINRREQFSRGRGHATEFKYFPLFNTQICVNVKPCEAHIGPSLISWVHDIGQIYTKPHTNITGGACILLIVVVMIPHFCISFFFFFSSAENIYNALLMVFAPLSPFVRLQRLPLLWFSFLMRPNNDQFPVFQRSSSPRGFALFLTAALFLSWIYASCSTWAFSQMQHGHVWCREGERQEQIGNEREQSDFHFLKNFKYVTENLMKEKATERKS